MNGLASEAARLEPIMFVVIAGTVMAATVLSPLLAWVLGVRAGRGNAVLLIGAHAASVALARALAERGVQVRVIDRNAARVEWAGEQGVPGVVGDATDRRWLDDVGSPHDAGWVVAWTGNDDVDQVAGRWGEERFGPGHAVVWSNKPAQGEQAKLDIAGGQSVALLIDAIEAKSVRVGEADEPGGLERVLGWIDNGVVTLAAPETKVPGPAKDRKFVGIGRAGEGGETGAGAGPGGAIVAAEVSKG